MSAPKLPPKEPGNGANEAKDESTKKSARRRRRRRTRRRAARAYGSSRSSPPRASAWRSRSMRAERRGAYCTAAGRALKEGLSTTVSGPGDGLTAELKEMPEEHEWGARVSFPGSVPRHNSEQIPHDARPLVRGRGRPGEEGVAGRPAPLLVGDHRPTPASHTLHGIRRTAPPSRLQATLLPTWPHPRARQSQPDLTNPSHLRHSAPP